MRDQDILLQRITLEELTRKIGENVKNEIDVLSKNLLSKNANDELLSRTEACEFLKIDASTLWHWTNQGKVKAYAISNRRYYKRTQLLECLKPVK